MIWRDMNGNPIKVGDIVMRDAADPADKYIGPVVFDKETGKLKIRMWSRFDKDVMNFVPINYTTVPNAYERTLIPRKSKWYYFRHRHRIPDVALVANAKPVKRRGNCIAVDAPIPGLN